MPDPRRLIATLTPTARRAMERAAERALRETHATVEPEHLLAELAVAPDTDLATLLRYTGGDGGRLAKDLETALGRLPRGSARIPALSAELLGTLTDAWVIASVDHGFLFTSSSALLAAMAENRSRRDGLIASVPALAAVFQAPLLQDPVRLRSLGVEAPAAVADGVPGNAALDEFTVDITAQARAGLIDPVIGRDAEIRQVIDVLMRRRQNNPILTGPAGVGKTAIVEGFARAVAAGRVPPRLSGLVVRSLDLGLLQAGASLRGEYEQRLRAVVDSAAAAGPRTVLFVDEAHMLIGGGGAPGQADAANLLKPALARGTLGMIAATTWGEYKRFIEKDPALARRFQVIRVAEPSEPIAVEMLRSLAPGLEAHHGVRILEEALAEAVRLSHRFVTGRQLPEKAISVLDTACARAAISRSIAPASLSDAERRVAAIDAELDRLRREATLHDVHAARLEALGEERGRAEERRLMLAGRWALEEEAVARLADLEIRLAAPGAHEALRTEWAGLSLELDEIRNAGSSAVAGVDGRAVAEVVSAWTGIPVGRMLADTLAAARCLKARMSERIIGQHGAIDTICRRVQTFYADLGEPGKPTGVFLLCGPSGVGKTETALTLAELLFGGTRALITVNMSEYQEAHAVSSLRGAPPGYVGYGAGGVLTEAVRRQPYCVLLLDEVEKAHPDVLELFYQVFDRGMLEDSEGQVVDFTNTLILLTSNVGAEALTELARRRPEADSAALTSAIRPTLLRTFPAAFLGRMTVVPYRPLGLPAIEAVARLKLFRIQERFAATGRGELTYHQAVLRAVAEQAGATETGARMVDDILTHAVLPALSARVLDSVADGRTVTGAHLALAPDGALTVEIRT